MTVGTRILMLMAIVALCGVGCGKPVEPPAGDSPRFERATIRIMFKQPVPVSYTLPMIENRGADADGAIHFRGSKSSGATNDQDLVTVNWEFVGSISAGRGDVYFFTVQDNARPDVSTERLVPYRGQQHPVLDSDRVSIVIIEDGLSNKAIDSDKK